MSSKQTIIDLERSFWDTMISKDAKKATALVATKLVMTGAQGVSAIERNAFAGMMGGASWELHDYALADVTVIFPKADVAVIGYTVTEHVSVDGKPVELRAADSSVWVHQGDQWLAVLHTESVLGDPFGRS